MSTPDVNKKNDKQERGFQAEIARRMGTTRQAVNIYLNGKRIPGPRMAKKLEDATGIPRQAWMYPDEHHNPLLADTADGNGTRADS